MGNEDNWLVSMRKQLGLTQDDVARALDVTTRTIINWENGHHEPRLTIRQVKKLCRVLQISTVDELPDNLFGPPQIEGVN